jgi:hypothetical protein
MSHTARCLLVLTLIISQGCAGAMARREEAAFQQELVLKDQAWIAARLKLLSMCPPRPTSLDQYKEKVQLRLVGADPFSGCDFRLIKLSNGASLDDWTWFWLPSHTVIVQAHEKALRERVTLRLYDEYMFGIAYHLAKAIDSAELTPEEHKQLFNYAWAWMFERTKNDAILFRQNVIRADEQDAQTRKVIAAIGVGLAAGVQGYAQAYARSYRPPTNCFGTQIAYSFSVTCY